LSNFNNQYSNIGGDGKTSTYNGSTYTISKYNVDYFSKQGKSASKNNITTNINLQKDKFNLLKHSLFEYGKK